MIDNKYFAIDAHAHIYPEKIASRAVAGTDNFYSTTSYGDGTVENLFKVGDAAGIDKYIVQSVATTPKQVKSINEFIAREVSEFPDKLFGLGTLHPDSEDIAGDIEHLIELGLHGVKLHPDIQNFKMDDYRCLKIYEICEKKNLPMLLHTGDKRYDNSNPNRFLPLLETYTNLTFVGAHFGGWSIWTEACKTLAGRPNLYVDCSSSFYYMTDDEIRTVIDAFGVDRVLFGTDYPMWNAKTEVERLLWLGLCEADYKKIFAENAIRAFSIDKWK